MPDLKVILAQSNIDPKERRRRLAQAYQLIMSWPVPGEQKPTPAVEDLGRDTTAGAETEDIHPVSQTSSDEPMKDQEE